MSSDLNEAVPTDAFKIEKHDIPSSTSSFSFLENNPYFSAGFGLAALGVAAASLKTVARTTVTLAQKRLISTLEVPSKDVAYPWLLEWLSHKQTAPISTSSSSTLKHSTIRRLYSLFKPPPPNNLSVSTSFLKRENGSTETKFSIQPGIGSYFFQYQGAWFYVERSREKTMIDLKSGSPWESIAISTASMDKHLFQSILLEAKESALKNQSGKLVIYNAWGTDWKPFGNPKLKRSLESVVLDHDIKTKLVNDIHSFLKNASWYYDRGIPYRRGYLLYGPPGTGKTSFIQSLAGSLDYNICLLNLFDRGMTDDKLALLLSNAPPRSFILLEDVDAVFQKMEQSDAHAAKFPPLLTFSGLLNALDGVASSEERIIFMTTNHIQRLDPALIRPGRVDVKQVLDYASDQQIVTMFTRFYGKDHVQQAHAFLEAARRINKPISTAQLQGHFVIYKSSAKEAIECIESMY